MKILALELSTAQGSLAWIDDVSRTDAIGKYKFNASSLLTWPNDRKDSGPFFDNVQQVVRQFGLPKRIIIGLGPGSYAGVRIAISTAIGLQAAAGAELVGYPSVCAMEEPADNYAVIGDARRRSFYLVTVSNRNVVGDYELHDESGMRNRLAKISASTPIISSEVLPQFQPPVLQRFPSAEVLAWIAVDADRPFSMPPLEPIYLREANVTIPKPIFGRGKS